MPIARLGILNTRFLYFIKAFEAIILDRETEDIMGDMATEIMLYRFISSIFKVNALS